MKINILALLVLVSGVFFFRNFLISKLIGDNITHDQQRYSETNAVSLIDLFLSPVKMPFNEHLELIQNGSNLLKCLKYSIKETL